MKKPTPPVKKQGWNDPSDMKELGTIIPASIRKQLDDTIVILAARDIPEKGLITRIVSRGIVLACAEFLKHATDAEYIKAKTSEKE